MQAPEPEHLPPEQRLALSHTDAELRPALACLFALDRRLGQIVASSSEPMLGQMRLAWWREQFGTPVPARPSGDAVLDAAGRHWLGEEAALVSLIDGWEELLVAQALTPDIAIRICNARAGPLARLAARVSEEAEERARIAGIRWAAADAAAHVTGTDERSALLAAGLGQASAPGGIGRGLRGIVVLEALALRSLRRGGRPLMEGRGAALTALRAGLLGR